MKHSTWSGLPSQADTCGVFVPSVSNVGKTEHARRARPSPPACQGQGPAHPPPSALGCLLLTLGVPVTQGGRPHVAQPDGPFAAAVHEGVAVMRVELGRCDHLCELLHVGRLDVDDIWHKQVKERTRGWGRSSGSGGVTGTAVFQCDMLAWTMHGGTSKNCGQTARPYWTQADAAQGYPAIRESTRSRVSPVPFQWYPTTVVFLHRETGPTEVTCSCNCATTCQVAQLSFLILQQWLHNSSHSV